MEPVSHYCHAVRTGDRLWISGTVGVRPDGSIPEDTADQFQVAIDSLDRCLRAAGGQSEHIVKVTVLLTNIADRALINPIRQRYFGVNRPASTLYEVSALVSPEMKVEIEAEAVIND